MSKSISAAESVAKIFQIYETSIMAGDQDLWITIWTEDCVQLPPGGPMVTGRQNLYNSISAWLEEHTVSEFKILVEPEVQEAGDWAFAHGQFSYHLTPTDGREPFDYEGKFLSVFKCQSDGEWRLHRDCFNSNILY